MAIRPPKKGSDSAGRQGYGVRHVVVEYIAEEMVIGEFEERAATFKHR